MRSASKVWGFSQGGECGGRGGGLWWVCPVGVVMVMVVWSSVGGWCCQPGACLVWLQFSQSPWPLVMGVGPPWWWAVMWSACRMGASHQGVRQVWSRADQVLRAAWGKSRRVVSPVSRCPVSGLV